MRNALVVLTAFGIASTLVGCNSNKPNNQPAAPTPPAPTKPATPDKGEQGRLGWTLNFQSKCAEDIDKSQCLGAYGFTVLTNGEFKVGPGPKGEQRNGTLSTDELQSLNTVLAGSIQSAGTRSAAHEAIEASESEDTITLVQGSNSPEVLVKVSNTELTFQTPTSADAKSLLTVMRNFAVKYYKLPFPDECSDGAAALRALTTAVQTCTVDTDCTYLDSNLESVPATSQGELITDDCSIITPLVVGNAQSVKVKGSEILEAIYGVRNACSENLMRADCNNIVTVQLKGEAPVCLQGVCKLKSGS